MEKHAVIDIGTNSIKFYIAQKEDGSFVSVIDDVAIVRLGEGLKSTGRISDLVMQRNCDAIKQFQKIAKKEGVKSISAVGTMCLRSASNSSDFISKVKNDIGIDIEVLAGEEEARLSYLGALSGLHELPDNIIMFDSGGGSTEFIYANGKNIDDKQSLNVGAVVLTDQFIKSDPVEPKQVMDAKEYLISEFDKTLYKKESCSLIGIGGTITNLAAIYHKMEKFDPELIQSTVLKKIDVNIIFKMLAKMSVKNRKSVQGLQPQRADVILGGILIIKSIMEYFKIDELNVSTKGLRHGLLFDRYMD